MDTALRSNYEKACNAYLEAFCKKHEFDIREANWVCGDVGGVANISEYYVPLSDIMIDIEKQAPAGEYWKYYDYAVRCHALEVSHPNYENWLRGCPVKSLDKLSEIERLKGIIRQSTIKLDNAIREW